MRSKEELAGVTKLGNQNVKYEYRHPNINTLETFEHKHPDVECLVAWKAPEFTSLCPKTGQPDFATIYIDYVPDKLCIESKSLKLYLFSYRNHGDFHEDVVCMIMKDVVKKIDPLWCRVTGDFYPRGGISINPVAVYSRPDYRVPEYIEKLLPLHRNNRKG